MSDQRSAANERVIWLLEDRARLVRMVGLTCWEQLPPQAQTALDGLASILDEAVEVIRADA